jgi:hypothetical protein
MHYSYLHLGLPNGYLLRGFLIKIRHLHNAKHPFYFNENLNASSEIQPESLISTWSNMLIQKGPLKGAEELQNILTASQFKANMLFMPLVYKVLEVCCNGTCLYLSGTNKVNYEVPIIPTMVAQ